MVTTLAPCHKLGVSGIADSSSLIADCYEPSTMNYEPSTMNEQPIYAFRE